MKKITLLLLTCFVFAQAGMAQAKWLDKAKRAVFSVITYDNEGKLLNSGNGFFITASGVALSDHSLFKGAQRGVVIDSDGKQMEVELILGASSEYDVIRFQVNTGGKKVDFLTIASVAPAVGEEVSLLPYSTKKDRSFATGKITEIFSIAENSNYYTLALELSDKMVSCPVVNASGQVFGITQKSVSKTAEPLCYAVGANYAQSLAVGALSASDATYTSIGIKTGLPESENDALVKLFMASSQVAPEEYALLLDDFIMQFPNSTDGYLRRASNYIYSENPDIEKADSDLQKALSLAEKKDDVYYNIAKLIYTYQLTGPEEKHKDWTLEKALVEIRNAIAVDPQPVYIQLEGDIQFAQHDYSAAFESYNKVNQSNMASAQTFFSTAKTKELMGGTPDEVIALMDSCIARVITPVTSADAGYFLERARVYMDAEKYRQAMLDYDIYYNAVHGNVNDVFYYYREQAAFHARQFQRALDDIAKAIELNPEEIVYHTEFGVINLRVGRYEDAERAFNKSISLDPTYAEAYRLLGVTLQQQKKIDEACANFAKAKELGDTAVDALIEKTCKK